MLALSLLMLHEVCLVIWYIILISWFLKILCTPKKEILSFIKQYEKLVADVRQKVNTRVEYAIVPANLSGRLSQLKLVISS